MVQAGTLRVGGVIAAGSAYGKVRGWGGRVGRGCVATVAGVLGDLSQGYAPPQHVLLLLLP